MKERIKKIFIPIFISLICGALSGKVVYSIYNNEGTKALSQNRLYLLEVGTYEDYNAMRESMLGVDYVYFEDEEKYNSVLAIVKDYDNIKKIKDIYNGDIEIKECYLEDKELNDKLEILDNKLKETNDVNEIKTIINEMLGVYNVYEGIKLVKIS